VVQNTKSCRKIGVIICRNVNREIAQFGVVNYRIYELKKDGKSKLNDVAELLNDLVNSKQLSFARVLRDSWYACKKLMFLIEDLGKIYYYPFKKKALPNLVCKKVNNFYKD